MSLDPTGGHDTAAFGDNLQALRALIAPRIPPPGQNDETSPVSPGKSARGLDPGPENERVLALGADAHTLLSAALGPSRETQLVHHPGELSPDELISDLARLGRFRFVLVRNVLEHVDEARGAMVLGRLRDLVTPVACVVIEEAASTTLWNSSRMRALAFDDWGATDHAQVYGYDSASYKITPDWLNAESWANPERWDRHRW